MRCIPIQIVALLCVGGAAWGSPLDGIWQSERDATLASLEAHGGFNEAQWELLSDPDFFGHMVQVYRGGRAFVIFEGECSKWLPVVIESTGPDTVRLRYEEGDWGPPPPEVEIKVDTERLLVPIRLLGDVHETFVRVRASEIAARHPCFTARIEEIAAPAAPEKASE